MIIIIPLGGKGERFKNEGYTLPKSLVRVLGKPIIEWILDSLQLNTKNDIDRVIIPYNSKLEEYRFEDMLKYKYPTINFVFIKLLIETKGAAETLYISLCEIEKKEPKMKDLPILSLDGDNFYNTDIIGTWNKEDSVFVFEDKNNNPLYSYIEIDGGKVVDIVEKRKISNYACTGAYGFKSWKELKMECKFIIDNDIKQNNEFYISCVISNMVKNNKPFQYTQIDESDYICLGTPLQVNMYILNNYVQKPGYKTRRICFDLDNTLVTYPTIPGDYSTCLPIQKTIDFLKYLKQLGNTIIIHTARRMRTHHSNLGKVNADIGKLTFDTLDRFQIPYDEIYFGKPDADFYIDDKGINCFDNLEKELGYFNYHKINPRDFNKITLTNSNTIEKRGSSLSGEIYYYLNIMDGLQNMFPKMISYDDVDNKWYNVELVDGITLNGLFLIESLTSDIFERTLSCIKKIHSYPVIDNDNINIYENYQNKLEARYKNYDYSQFPNSSEMYDFLMSNLKEYEERGLGIKSVIHGDLVFTNILIDKNRNVKFIDMRGKQGNVLTIYGDRMYDYAKLYQSLIGYDEILQDKMITNEKYRKHFIDIIEREVTLIYGEHGVYYLKIITAMLFFTLIPLHNNDKCMKYYQRVKPTVSPKPPSLY